MSTKKTQLISGETVLGYAIGSFIWTFAYEFFWRDNGIWVTLLKVGMFFLAMISGAAIGQAFYNRRVGRPRQTKTYASGAPTPE